MECCRLMHFFAKIAGQSTLLPIDRSTRTTIKNEAKKRPPFFRQIFQDQYRKSRIKIDSSTKRGLRRNCYLFFLEQITG